MTITLTVFLEVVETKYGPTAIQQCGLAKKASLMALLPDSLVVTSVDPECDDLTLDQNPGHKADDYMCSTGKILKEASDSFMYCCKCTCTD